LRKRGVKGSSSVAQKALTAAKAQSVTLPAQDVASRIVAELAGAILALKGSIESIDEELVEAGYGRLLEPSVLCGSEPKVAVPN
jgi:hypothetical protein